MRSSRKRFTDVGPAHREAAFTLFAGAYDESLVNMSAIGEPEFGPRHRQRNLTRLESLSGVVAGTVAVAPLLESIFGGRTLEADFDLYAGEVAETNRLPWLAAAPVAPRRGLGLTKEVRWYGDR